MSKRIQWEMIGPDGPEQTTAYMTNVPGLVTFRYPGGWYVGHFDSGRRVSNYPLPRQPDAQLLAEKLGPLANWPMTLPDISPVLAELRQRVWEVESADWKPEPFEACGDDDCLARKDHPGAHKASGRVWRRT